MNRSFYKPACAVHPSRGIGLVEVVIASAILVLIVTGIASVYRIMLRSSGEILRGTEAQFLLEEGFESVKVMRDTAWSLVGSSTPGTSYTLVWNAGTWNITTTPNLIDGIFDRRVVFSRVYRDSDDDIASSGTLDTDTYGVTVSVAWRTQAGTTTRSIGSYIGNLFE